MILLTGSDTDNILKHFAVFLIKQRQQFIFFNQRRLLTDYQVSNGHFTFGSKKYYFRDISGVLNRVAAPSPKIDVSLHYQQSLLLLKYVLDNELQNVLNPSIFSVTNDSKLWQLSNINTKYIKIPRSFVVAKKNIKDFISNIGYKLIFKSLSSCRSIVQELDSKKLEQSTSSEEPVLLQELVEGDNVRVHVIKDKVISTIIRSNKIDYRYDSSIFLEYSLPLEIEYECRQISQDFNLLFCGIDLIKTSENKYYILEVNPSPGYSLFEKEATHQKISEALMGALK